MTTTKRLNRIKKKKVKPTMSITELRSMAQKASKRHDVPIKVTKYMGRGHRYADGVATRKIGDKTRIKLHPILQYRDKRYVRDVIGHEIDHANVFDRPLLKRWG